MCVLVIGHMLFGYVCSLSIHIMDVALGRPIDVESMSVDAKIANIGIQHIPTIASGMGEAAVLL